MAENVAAPIRSKDSMSSLSAAIESDNNTVLWILAGEVVRHQPLSFIPVVSADDYLSIFHKLCPYLSALSASVPSPPCMKRVIPLHFARLLAALRSADTLLYLPSGRTS